MTERILITGSAGGVGTLMRPRLAREGRVLRLLDVAEQPPAAPGEAVEIITASVTDMAAMEAACAGVDAVIHLGGYSLERGWDDILDVNINGTHVVFEAARRQGVPRVIFASSNHAVGFVPRADGEVAGDAVPRPDTNYGVSKAAGEAIASHYADRYGIGAICVRIGSCFEKPRDVRMLSTWLSPADGARLFEAALAFPDPGFRVLWGVSDNTRRWFSLEEAKAIGYVSQDDSEVYAAELLAEHGEPDLTQIPHNLVGGVWVSADFDTAKKEAGR
ncbi:nucleoside-diphosphate-sugar epimerase [Crossiella equi]|uniref:Nucleoside-diphosphate-sugar epimerase n=1 Tax=Crossiella equi TaxID=130796 RepID=A0ABS5AAH1_9PSEU|nr:NAD(P)-dependent oxidoreductase [Crossiella equi]MBP2473579.1 nucleoside-diphosphate-sugar epimerase [Crossiella equi]